MHSKGSPAGKTGLISVALFPKLNGITHLFLWPAKGSADRLQEMQVLPTLCAGKTKTSKLKQSHLLCAYFSFEVEEKVNKTKERITTRDVKQLSYRECSVCPGRRFSEYKAQFFPLNIPGEKGNRE